MIAPAGGPSPSLPAGPAGPDAHLDLGVEVRRDLAGSGRLARGGQTRFSTLRLRSAGPPAPPAEPPGAAAPAPNPAAETAAADARPSPLRRLLRWLGMG